MAADASRDRKPLRWIGSSRDDVQKFPEEVSHAIGYALWVAQCGDKDRSAKPLKGFKGAGVLEVVRDHDGDTHRAIYTVRFREAVYVLHVFQKKSKSGIKTPRHEIELVEARLQRAKLDYEQWLKERKP
jgi:phage-related protein